MISELLMVLAKGWVRMVFSLGSGRLKPHSGDRSSRFGLIAVLFLAANFFTFNNIWGQTNTWDGSSNANWNTAANWSRNHVPLVSEDVVIPNGITTTISVNTAAVCASFTMSGGNRANTVLITGTNSLAVSGAITINSGTGNNDDKTLNVAGGTLSCASVTMATTGNDNRSNYLTLSTGTITVSGDITMSSPSPRNEVIITGAGTLNVGGSFMGDAGSGLTTAVGSTVNYTGAGQAVKTPTAPSTYYNLGLAGSGNKTFGAALTISGNLSISGAVANLGTFTHTANTLTLGGIGQFNGSHGSTASAATFKNNTYFLSTSNGRVNVAVCSAPASGTGTTYYSSNATSGGDWDDNNSWTTNSDGTGGPLAAGVWPGISDNVVVLSGHTITINAITDNGYCGISPDGLGRSNIGAGGGTGFNGSNLAMFYQTGNIVISGTLSVISGINMMVEGYTHITSTGTFSLTSYLVNAGYLEADASSTLTTLDDLSLTGNSTTIINTTVTSADDLNIDHTNATLCGTGTSALLNSGGSAINYTNSATVAQICTSFTVTCSGGGCAGFPVTGTGTVLLGITGPGGVGNSSNNKLWLRANDLSLSNGAAVTSWPDASGNGLAAVANTPIVTSNQPTFVTNSVNTLPSISFDGGDLLNLGTPASLNLIPRTDAWSVFIAFNVSGGSIGTFLSKATSNNATKQYQYTIDDGNPGRFGGFMGGTYYNTGAVATGAWTIGTGLTSASATGHNTFLNETVDLVAQAVGTGTVPTTDVLIGARRTDASTATYGFNLTGNIGEIALYNSVVNTAQRMIIDNYLSAKYATTLLAASDVYTMDTPANGNYDFDVAGIGQAADGSNHKDAQGTGIVRMWSPSGLGNSEFLLWGHDNTALFSTTSIGVLAPIQERLSRTWRVSEVGDVGTVSVSFDISQLSSPLGSNLRLLIDRDGDGFGDNDVTPIAGSFVNNVVVFSGVNFQSGDRFTLGNTDITKPLPIELLSFTAKLKNDVVQLKWSTATELNNDFFTIERASNLEQFVAIGQPIRGAGTTNERKDYSVTDENPLYGLSYYRLKQVDFDGQTSYSDIRVIDYDGPKFASLTVYPNPSDGRKLTLLFTGLKEQRAVPVQLYNVQGQLIYETVLDVETPGTISHDIEFGTPLRSGIYLIRAGQTLQLTRKIFID